MPRIEVEESALESIKAQVQRLQQERDELLEALKPLAGFAKHFPLAGGKGNRPRSGSFYEIESHGLGADEITVEDMHRAANLIARCTTTPKVME